MSSHLAFERKTTIGASGPSLLVHWALRACTAWSFASTKAMRCSTARYCFVSGGSQVRACFQISRASLHLFSFSAAVAAKAMVRRCSE